MSLKQAIKTLTTTNQSLDVVARGLVVSPLEVYEALKDATPDTAEFVALSYLAKYNPYTPTTTRKK